MVARNFAFVVKGFVKVRPIKEFRVSYPDPDSIRSVDRDPDSESGSRSRREKNRPTKIEKVKKYFMLEVLDVLF